MVMSGRYRFSRFFSCCPTCPTALVDTLALLFVVILTAASIHDRDGARLALHTAGDSGLQRELTEGTLLQQFHSPLGSFKRLSNLAARHAGQKP